MSGPCAKQVVTATVVTPDGRRFAGTNHCLAPQASCPRSGMPTGQGYELCRDVCRQPAHAEVNALAAAGAAARGAVLRLQGHTYACAACREAAAGIARIAIEAPPRGMPRY